MLPQFIRNQSHGLLTFALRLSSVHSYLQALGIFFMIIWENPTFLLSIIFRYQTCVINFQRLPRHRRTTSFEKEASLVLNPGSVTHSMSDSEISLFSVSLTSLICLVILTTTLEWYLKAAYVKSQPYKKHSFTALPPRTGSYVRACPETLSLTLLVPSSRLLQNETDHIFWVYVT